MLIFWFVSAEVGAVSDADTLGVKRLRDVIPRCEPVSSC